MNQLMASFGPLIRPAGLVALGGLSIGLCGIARILWQPKIKEI